MCAGLSQLLPFLALQSDPIPPPPLLVFSLQFSRLLSLTLLLHLYLDIANLSSR
ncbi:hypothetical protein ACTXT7_011859 [Hymenolepis weldensis]